MARTVDVDQLVERALAGDPRSVGRLITLVEDAGSALPELAAALAPYTGTAQIIGLTGAPGVGKSTLTSELVRAYRSQGRRVGVLAVDPSSPFTGGALLGDRVRMQDHATDPVCSSARWPPVGTSAVCSPPRRQCVCSTRLAMTWSWSRPSVCVKLRSRAAAHRHHRRGARARHGRRDPGGEGGHPRGRRRLRGEQGRPRGGCPRSCGSCARCSHLGAAREWAPPVLTSTATTREGLDELVGRDRAPPGLGHRGRGRSRGKRRSRLLREVEALAAERFKLAAAARVERDDGLVADLDQRRPDPYRVAEELVRRAAEQGWRLARERAMVETDPRTAEGGPDGPGRPTSPPCPGSRSTRSTGRRTRGGRDRSGSAGRASTRSPAACTRPATGAGRGRSGSSPASATPSRPTSVQDDPRRRRRRACRWRSTCPR